MAGKKKAKGIEAVPEKTSLVVSRGGIKTGQDFANFMSALMSDVISGAVSPSTANAACNAGGKLLKVVELQMKHGTPTKGGGKVLELALQQPLMNGNPVQ